MGIRTASRHDVRAVLVGLDSMQGLQLARLLSGRGIRVVAIAADERYHTVRTNVSAPVDLAPTQGVGLVTLLEDLAPSFQDRPVLFPCQDHGVLTVSRFRDQLESGYRIHLPAPEVVETMMDKELFDGFAREVGLRTPKTHFIRSVADARTAASDMLYPVILKPPIRTAVWLASAGAKVLLIPDSDSLVAAWRTHGHTAPALIAQAWIPGTDADLYAFTAYYSDTSEVLVTFVARKLRQWPIQIGQASAAVEFHDDGVAEQGHRLFKAADMRGLASVEFKKHSETGELYVIEANIGRPTGRSANAEAGGVELHYTMYCDVLSLPLPESRTQRHRDAKWVHLLRDFLAAREYVRRGELTYSAWIRSLRGPKAFALWSLRDPLPFVVAVASVIRGRVGRGRGRTRSNVHDA